MRTDTIIFFNNGNISTAIDYISSSNTINVFLMRSVRKVILSVKGQIHVEVFIEQLSA